MKSMTGYGRAAAALGNHTLTVAVSSVNRKSLDLAISLPEEWEGLEAEVSELVRKVALRGRITLKVELTGSAGGEDAAWDATRVNATIDQLALLAKGRGVTFELTPELLWQIASTLRQKVEPLRAEEARSVLLATVDEALRAFSAMRAKEGEALLVDFLSRLEVIRRHWEVITQRAPLVPGLYRELFLKRLREAGLSIDLNDERVLKEIAIFCDRCDVTEEITRFRSHLDQFVPLLRSEGEIGRKAEFILQEMGREVNTSGSKANDLTISRSVIELKNELERIREQIANVE